MPTPQEHLKRLTSARQAWLGDAWTTIGDRGGIGYQAIRRFRDGIVTPTAATKRALETGLYWPRGIIDDILNTTRPGTRFDYLIDLEVDAETGQNTVTVDDLRSQWQRIRDANGVAAADEWLLGQVRDRPGSARSDVG